MQVDLEELGELGVNRRRRPWRGTLDDAASHLQGNGQDVGETRIIVQRSARRISTETRPLEDLIGGREKIHELPRRVRLRRERIDRQRRTASRGSLRVAR